MPTKHEKIKIRDILIKLLNEIIQLQKKIYRIIKDYKEKKHTIPATPAPAAPAKSTKWTGFHKANVDIVKRNSYNISIPDYKYSYWIKCRNNQIIHINNVFDHVLYKSGSGDHEWTYPCELIDPPSQRIHTLIRKQEVMIDLILKKLDENNGKKELHWAWYFFPASIEGNSDFKPKTSIKNQQEAVELMKYLSNKHIEKWISILTKVKILRHNDKSKVERFRKEWSKYNDIKTKYPDFYDTIINFTDKYNYN